MYSKIEIYNTDFTDKYLLKVEDKTMYVGFLIKEVVKINKIGLVTCNTLSPFFILNKTKKLILMVIKKSFKIR